MDPYAHRSKLQRLWKSGSIDMFKSFFGLLAGAIVSSAILSGLSFFSSTMSVMELVNIVPMTVGLAIYTFIVALVVGLPIHFILYHFGLRGAFVYILAACFAGIAIFAVPRLFSIRSLSDLPDQLTFAATIGLWSATVAGVAWWLRRPDKDPT